ncbi:uracil-DNA glycosylase-like protein [Eremomyces bilateralis CBS 781.70]|uniref:Uracil-DNA glycosylase-like protein n=1 Tax=Eremomyces bilateralis CBS 781.70 TaxID=1392243 RepID=A0A6G1G2M1_9PEZI|nr:uracil-DNA glycosylase-like protein [Eremomyces bilateralis CBS 781.70]KAF1812293.1 uracil-DNA glycosylase-like protein [Eremomyces bilateralis CBS 781.70]
MPVSDSDKLRIGYVPEHFSTPLHFAQKHYGLDASLIPFPSGTGHMVESLKAKDIDIGMGLTEGWVAGLGKAGSPGPPFPFKIVGTYVSTPLSWAISTGKGRKGEFKAKLGGDESSALQGKKMGVSRIGSGSYVMGYVLADTRGWLRHTTSPFEVIPADNFQGLRDAVNSGKADFFMWEHYTSNRYYEQGAIENIGWIDTPWSSWKIVAADPEDWRLGDFAKRLNKGVEHFNQNGEEAVEYISTQLDYSAADARAWMKTVEFPTDVRKVDQRVIRLTIDLLAKAGVIEKDRLIPADIIREID